jgi:hypothetical protein
MKYELHRFHLHRLDMKYELRTSYPAYEDGTDRVFRNVGIQQSDAREIPKRIHTRFKRLTLPAACLPEHDFPHSVSDLRAITMSEASHGGCNV